MLRETLNHFTNIAKMPHCSFHTEQLKEYLSEFAKRLGYEVNEDEAGNLLCQKGEPKVCLQGHYDMVCMGNAPEIELYKEDGWLKAKNSSLGADNGMGVAIMLSMMSAHENLECLFTNNEEVGLLGANNLNLDIKSPNLLNLDSEEVDEVIIGCAGGVDIFGKIDALEKKQCDGEYFEVKVSGLKGGHSGVDIGKNIPNAIKILGKVLAQNECEIVHISGGERNNSIPVNAKAVVKAKQKPVSKSKYVSIDECKSSDEVLKNSKNVLNLINSFSQGVRAHDEELNMPITSINLSTLKQNDKEVVFEFFARSMDENEQEDIKMQMDTLLKVCGFEVSFENETSPWKPIKSDFAVMVKSISEGIIKNVKIKAIHAGLECGVIVKKQPSITGVCSIGPTIKNPHSVDERCDCASVEKIIRVVDKVIKSL